MLCWPFTSGQKQIASTLNFLCISGDCHHPFIPNIVWTSPNHAEFVYLLHKQPQKTTFIIFILKAKQQIGQFSHHSALSEDGSGRVGMEDSNGGSKDCVGDSGSAFWRLSWNMKPSSFYVILTAGPLVKWKKHIKIISHLASKVVKVPNNRKTIKRVCL